MIRSRPGMVLGAMFVAVLATVMGLAAGCARLPVGESPAPGLSSTSPGPGGQVPAAALLVTPGRRHGSGCGQGHPSRCAETLTLPDGWDVKVYSNFPMTGSDAVTRAVVVVHGGARHAKQDYQEMMTAAGADAWADEHTIVLAPWFPTAADEPGSHHAYWDAQGWKIGANAIAPAGLSSFAVMDSLLASLADPQRFPRLTHITMAGHSSGGQFTQRYAAFGQAPNWLHRISFTYAPMNPSSYVYFDAQRPDTHGMFHLPNEVSCPNYNDYKYGLQARTGYVAELTATQASAQYASRQVTLFNGSQDDYQNGDMDNDCAAMLEGPDRATRGANYVNYIHNRYPNAPHTRVVIAGVGHHSKEMFTSPLAQTALFGIQPTQDN